MSLRHAVLGLLVDKPASGYDLMKRFNTSLANVWPATQSQVYGELARLDAAGLIDVAAEGPRGRKEYTITDAGLAELRRWLTETEPKRVRNNDAVLRVFFLSVLTPEQARGYLTGLAEQAAATHTRLQELKESVDWEEDGMVTVNGRLALEYGLRLFTMYEEWANWAAKELAASNE
jgi:PadR family transcriptional regulator AphA